MISHLVAMAEVIVMEVVRKEATWKVNMEEEEIPMEIADKGMARVDKDTAEVDKVMEEVEAIQEMVKAVMQDLKEALSTVEVNVVSITRREDMVKVRENMVKIKEGTVKIKVVTIMDMEEEVKIPALRTAPEEPTEERATTTLVQCITRTSTLVPVAMEICSTKRWAC